jgi:stage II sporulation protein D
MCVGAPGFAKEQMVRIAVVRGAGDCIISVRGPYQIRDGLSGRLLLEGRSLPRSRALYRAKKFYIGTRAFASEYLIISAGKDIRVQTPESSQRFRGSVHVQTDKDGRLVLVNHLDLESYVRGVLYHEISDKWPMEAMKAQAVAARTYALYQIRHGHRHRLSYDVTSDVYSQVYGGRGAERYRTNLAVDRTAREVLTFEGKVIPAYFHSNSGGHTEDAGELWDHKMAPLAGRPDPFSEDAPGYNWTRNFRSGDVRAKLKEKGLDVGEIKDIKIVKTTASGRVKELVIESRAGKKTKVEGKVFRSALGANLVRSSLYEVVMKGYYFDLVGRGWGHGVGMSQWGAYNMSRRRKDYKEILSFYYPGAVIRELDKLE